MYEVDAQKRNAMMIAAAGQNLEMMDHLGEMDSELKNARGGDDGATTWLQSIQDATTLKVFDYFWKGYSFLDIYRQGSKGELNPSQVILRLDQERKSRMDWVRKQLDHDGSNALHVAADFNNCEVIKVLQRDLSHKFMMELAHAQDQSGNTPLVRATREGNAESFKLLEKYFFDLPELEMSPQPGTMIAVPISSTRAAVVSAPLTPTAVTIPISPSDVQIEIDPWQIEKEMRIFVEVIHLAVKEDQTKMLEHIFNLSSHPKYALAGIHQTVVEKYQNWHQQHGTSALIIAAENGRIASVEAMNFFINRGIIPVSTPKTMSAGGDHIGFPAIFIAADLGHHEIVRVLMNQDYDDQVKAEDRLDIHQQIDIDRGSSPGKYSVLQWAVFRGQLEVVDELTRHPDISTMMEATCQFDTINGRTISWRQLSLIQLAQRAQRNRIWMMEKVRALYADQMQKCQFKFDDDNSIGSLTTWLHWAAFTANYNDLAALSKYVNDDGTWKQPGALTGSSGLSAAPDVKLSAFILPESIHHDTSSSDEHGEYYDDQWMPWQDGMPVLGFTAFHWFLLGAASAPDTEATETVFTLTWDALERFDGHEIECMERYPLRTVTSNTIKSSSIRDAVLELQTKHPSLPATKSKLHPFMKNVWKDNGSGKNDSNLSSMYRHGDDKITRWALVSVQDHLSTFHRMILIGTLKGHGAPHYLPDPFKSYFGENVYTKNRSNEDQVVLSEESTGKKLARMFWTVWSGQHRAAFDALQVIVNIAAKDPATLSPYEHLAVENYATWAMGRGDECHYERIMTMDNVRTKRAVAHGVDWGRKAATMTMQLSTTRDFRPANDFRLAMRSEALKAATMTAPQSMSYRPGTVRREVPTIQPGTGGDELPRAGGDDFQPRTMMRSEVSDGSDDEESSRPDALISHGAEWDFQFSDHHNLFLRLHWYAFTGQIAKVRGIQQQHKVYADRDQAWLQEDRTNRSPNDILFYRFGPKHVTAAHYSAFRNNVDVFQVLATEYVGMWTQSHNDAYFQYSYFNLLNTDGSTPFSLCADNNYREETGKEHRFDLRIVELFRSLARAGKADLRIADKYGRDAAQRAWKRWNKVNKEQRLELVRNMRNAITDWHKTSREKRARDEKESLVEQRSEMAGGLEGFKFQYAFTFTEPSLTHELSEIIRDDV